MPEFRNIPGINIQWPWSELILSGKKTVETRSYPIPDKHLGVPLAVIETPGPNRRSAGFTKARMAGVIVFDKSFQYLDYDSWHRDFDRHLVYSKDPLYGFDEKKQKWGWRISSVLKFHHHLAAPEKKGIVFARECRVPSDSVSPSY